MTSGDRTVVFCVRERVSGRAVVPVAYGRALMALYHLRACVRLVAPAPRAEAMAALRRHLCDQHGNPVLEVDP